MKTIITAFIASLIALSLPHQLSAQTLNSQELKGYLQLMRSLGHDGTINFYSTWDKESKKKGKKQVQQAIDLAKFQFGSDLTQNNILSRNASFEIENVCTSWKIVKTSEIGLNTVRKSSSFDLSSSAGLSTAVSAAAAGLAEVGSLIGLGSFGLVGGLFGSLGLAGAGNASFDGFFDFGVSNSQSSEKINYFHITKDVKCIKYKRYQRAKVSITPDLQQISTKLIAQTTYKKISKLTQYMSQRSDMIKAVIETIIENPVIELEQIEHSLSRQNNNFEYSEISRWLKTNINDSVTVSSVKEAMEKFGYFMIRELKKQKEVISAMEANSYLNSYFSHEIKDIKKSHDELIGLISRLENNELLFVLGTQNQYVGPVKIFDTHMLSLINLSTASPYRKINNTTRIKENYITVSYDNYVNTSHQLIEARKIFLLGKTTISPSFKNGWIEPLIAQKNSSDWEKQGYKLKRFSDVYDSKRIYNHRKYNQIVYELKAHNCRVYHVNYNNDSVDIICPQF